MIIELKDCEAWIEEHKLWVLKTDGEYACPMMSYGAKNLLDTINGTILPEKTEDNSYLYSSIHSMIAWFWNDDLIPFNEWIKQRNAEQITFDMVAGDMDEVDIIDSLRAVLDLDRDDKYTSLMIKSFIEYYNSKQLENSAKILGYEEILKGE